MIFNILGTPKEEDIAFVTDQKANDYLRSYKPQARVDLSKKYPGATKD